MKKNKKWFSLIEVVIATSIISISVFWVYKLIWENTKIINYSYYYTQAHNLFPTTQECINNIWFEKFDKWIWNEYYFNFWNTLNKCNTWALNEKILIDNIEYNIKWVINNFWTGYIDWNIFIENEQIKTLSWKYIQLNK